MGNAESHVVEAMLRRLCEFGMSVKSIAKRLDEQEELIRGVLSGDPAPLALYQKVERSFGICPGIKKSVDSACYRPSVVQLPLLTNPYVGENPRLSPHYAEDWPLCGHALSLIDEDDLSTAYLLRAPSTHVSPYSVHQGDILLISQRPPTDFVCGIVLVVSNKIPRLARLTADGDLEAMFTRDRLYKATEVGVCLGIVWRALAYKELEH